MAEAISSSILYLASDDSCGPQPASTLIEHASAVDIICQPSAQINHANQLEDRNVQMIPVQEVTSANGQEYVVLAPMTVLKDNEAVDGETTNAQSRFVPANRILAESVRGLFFSTDSQSSFKSAEGNTSNEDYLDHHGDESSNEYGHSAKRQRRTLVDADGKRIDPFSDECRIPLPGSMENPYFDSKTFVRRRNERERARVRSVNEGFERLRAHLPFENESKHRRLSKVETLQCAIQYIQHLQAILDED